MKDHMEKWEGTQREPDVFDAIRGGHLVGSTGMVDDHDQFREAAEQATGKLVLVNPDDPDWIALEVAVRKGDILKAMDIRNRMVLAKKLTITDRFSQA